MHSLLEISHLNVTFKRHAKIFYPVRNVALTIAPGECVALIGESGCGKSMTAMSITRLPPTDKAAVDGKIIFENEDLLQLPDHKLREVRRHGIAYIFQDPANTLNPVIRIGDQIAESLLNKKQQNIKPLIRDLLTKVKLPDPERCAHAYPCELSGGMQQRVSIAMALASQPRLLIADEPTTALDVVAQQAVLDLIIGLAEKQKLAVLLITHNLAIVAKRASRIYVMYGGMIVESGSAKELSKNPMHPYTRGLRAAMPTLDRQRNNRLEDIPGIVPPPDAWPPGCPFEPRCRHPQKSEQCRHSLPSIQCIGNRYVRCFYPTAEYQSKK